ncbi:MAG: tetratricopeptide repeat protein, partial [Actinomycetota bacterium]
MVVEAAADPLARGEEALRAGDWELARSAFESALDLEESPEARAGLGRTLWWLQDVDGALFQL